MKKHLYNWYLNGVTSSDSGYGSGIEITTNLYTDRVNVVRNAATSNFTLNVPTDYFCAWSPSSIIAIRPSLSCISINK